MKLKSLVLIFLAIAGLQGCKPMATAPELPPIVDNESGSSAVAAINNTEVVDQEASSGGQ